jgi:hypothetical protein
MSIHHHSFFFPTSGLHQNPFDGYWHVDVLIEKLVVPDQKDTLEVKIPLLKVFQSTPLLLRFINCCICWMTCAFLFYGLTLNSVTLAGNSYLDFMLTAMVEIPAHCAVYFLLNKLGRRGTQCTAFMITGISCFAVIFVPTG